MDVSKLIEKAGGPVELGGMLGVSRTTVLGWRKENTIPGNRVAQISAVLNIPPDELLPIVQAPRTAKCLPQELASPAASEAGNA